MTEPSVIPNPEKDDGRDPAVREYIDNTLSALLHGLTSHPPEPLSIALKSRARRARHIINPNSRALEAVPRPDKYKTYFWPGKTAHEAWTFAAILQILAILDQAIRMGQLISKRDIYYIDPGFFRAQGIVDRIVDDLAYTIGVNRTALNVEAAAKGLVMGDFRLIRGPDVLIDMQSAMEDTLIPRVEDGDEIDITRARWVLVIEKEAVFHRLARISYHTKALAGEGILVTGKGYPDFLTRRFLRAISDSVSNQSRTLPRFYALTDGDPHGMAIMSTYKYGSAAHLHQNARLSIPRLQWLGLRVSDIIAVPEVLGDKALLTLTMRDRRKIVTMLHNSPVWASDGPEPQWRAELQRMLVLNLKAEIEILYECHGGLEGWINRRMFRQE
ncbi:Winged helix-turn-helix transcription repressor DNA-binding [Penicillium sp. DV-2018c]|nr:Winged helix-turn-helix transcription repressor DNA-binding [Penicillium sp. DV-2018c]